MVMIMILTVVLVLMVIDTSVKSKVIVVFNEILK